MEDPRGGVSGCSGCHHQRQACCSLRGPWLYLSKLASRLRKTILQ